MALMDCPECGRQVSDRAAACPQCGCPLQVSAPLRVTPYQANPSALTIESGVPMSPLQEIAYRQKLLLYAVLIDLLCIHPLWMAFQVPRLLAFGIVLAVAKTVFAFWCFFKLGQALRMPQFLIGFYSLGLLLPLLFSALTMYILVERASRALKKAGVRVGLLGADLATVP
jgi:hypothetical protein